MQFSSKPQKCQHLRQGPDLCGQVSTVTAQSGLTQLVEEEAFYLTGGGLDPGQEFVETHQHRAALASARHTHTHTPRPLALAVRHAT
eukprot:scaffold35899_cov34-Prasinocladus_malaysianus.AAC.1